MFGGEAKGKGRSGFDFVALDVRGDVAGVGDGKGSTGIEATICGTLRENGAVSTGRLCGHSPCSLRVWLFAACKPFAWYAFGVFNLIDVHPPDADFSNCAS